MQKLILTCIDQRAIEQKEIDASGRDCECAAVSGKIYPKRGRGVFHDLTSISGSSSIDGKLHFAEVGSRCFGIEGYGILHSTYKVYAAGYCEIVCWCGLGAQSTRGSSSLVGIPFPSITPIYCR